MVTKQCFKDVLFGTVSMYERKVSMVVIDIFAKIRINFFSMRTLPLIGIRLFIRGGLDLLSLFFSFSSATFFARPFSLLRQ